MRALTSSVLAMVLGLSLVASALAQADGRTGETAVPLTRDQVATGSLVGNSAGAFTYFTFPYAGDRTDAVLTIHFSPSNPSAANAFGVGLWQGNVRIGTIKGNEGDTQGTIKLTFYSDKEGAMTAQVFNYLSNVNIGFDITVAGDAIGPAGTPAASPAPVVVPAAAPAPVAAPASGGDASSPDHPATFNADGTTGLLTGHTEGKFAFYTADYPGDGTDRMITYDFSPALAGNAFAVEVWQGTKVLGRISGSGEFRGSNKITFFSAVAGPVLIKVDNYAPNLTVGYTLRMTTPVKV